MGFLHLPGVGKVHFHEYGTGNKPMLAFHGYGMTGKQFNVLEKSVLSQYHVYGIDHFFHGESTLTGWTEAQIVAGLPRAQVRLYLEAWFEMYGRQRISLMAYSIGADIALLLLEDYADCIDELFLMAPDGIVPYKGFRIIQHHPLGKRFFKTATKSKWLAPSILKGLRRANVIDESLYKIAYNEIDTPKKRQDVYYSLNLIKHLVPDTGKLAGLINQHHIKCTFVFGKHDLLFPKGPAMAFVSQLNNAEVHEVPMGHWLVTRELDEYLVNCSK
jgi:pimeloyl-ACP methyl ester carboxylesterase